MKNGFFALMIIAVFHACNNGTATEGSTAENVTTDSMEQKQPSGSDDTVSREIFAGNLPCVDCDSIQTVLYLKADSTFEKATTYMGVQDSTVATAPQKGKWTMIGDTVTLLQTTAPNRFVRRDTVLLQLDLMGLPMMSKKGDTLTLKRRQ